jgi:hypothetical protein
MPIFFLAALAPAGVAFGADAKPFTGLFHNEDSTQIFFTQTFPPGKAGEVIDKYVDVMAGAAVSVLANGADVVYLFNHFQGAWPQPLFRQTLNAMNSLDALLKRSRCVGITYRDITAPNEAYETPLPATGKTLAFRIKLGPIPENHGIGTLRVGLASATGTAASAPIATVNGKPCGLGGETTDNGLRLLSFAIPPAALSKSGILEIKLAATDSKELTVQRLDASLEGQP